MTSHRPPAIVVNDSTPRDIALSQDARIGMARALDRAGVDEIEFAAPTDGGRPVDTLATLAAALCRAKPVLWGPMTRATTDLASRAGIRAVHLALPLMGGHIRRDGIRARIARVVDDARARGLAVAVGGEDASLADFGLVCATIAACEAAGAHRFRFVDSRGLLDPGRSHALFRELCAETDLELEFRGADARGLATANTLAAVRGGATSVSVTTFEPLDGAAAPAANARELVTALHLSPPRHARVWVSSLPACSDHLMAVPVTARAAHRMPSRAPSYAAAE